MFFLAQSHRISTSDLKKNRCKGCTSKYCFFDKINLINEGPTKDKPDHLTLQKGETLVIEGQAVKQLFLILDGYVKIASKFQANKEAIVAIGKPGEIIGVQAMLSKVNSKYSATALGTLKVCVLEVSAITSLAEKMPEVTLVLTEMLAKETDFIYKRWLSAVHKQIPGRLADTLLYLAHNVYNSHKFTTNLSRQELAALIGISRENMIRNLTVLKKDKIINLNGNQFEILENSMLEKISELG